MSIDVWKRRLQEADIAKELDLTWLTEPQSADIRAHWLAIWNELEYAEHFHEDCRQRLERCVPVAMGPSRGRRLTFTQSQLVWVADPREPDVLFMSLSHTIPSLLWNRLGGDAESAERVVRPYLAERTSVLEMPRSVRVAKGLGVSDRSVIETVVEGTELWMDDAYWCSAFDDDPWLDAPESLNMLAQSSWLRDVSKEHPGRFPSVSWRPLWSNAALRLEQHPWGVWVFEARYAPANDGAVVDIFNEIAGAHLPADLPVDILASLLRGECIDDVRVADMKSRGEETIDRLAFTCALHAGQAEASAALREAIDDNADDGETLLQIADLAAAYGHHSLLFELASLTRGTDAGNVLRNWIAPATAEVLQ